MNETDSKTEESGYSFYLEKAVEAARAAGKILISGLNRRIKIEYKGRIDLVTEIDRESQECILNILSGSFPDHEFLAEEAENHDLDGGKFLWVIDPLDGTTNYAHGYRFFAISIALVIDNVVCVGLVYDPWGDELFTAVKEQGAFLNGLRIQVSDESELEQSLLVTGFPYDIRKGNITNLSLFNHLILKAQAIRRDGSAALDLAYIAAGRFDGLWELKLHPWDVAAGILIIEEAGGMVSKFTGGHFQLTSYDLLATNGKIHRALKREISEIQPNNW